MHYFNEGVLELANDRNSSLKKVHLPTFSFVSISLTKEEVNVISAVYEDGRATCRFSFNTTRSGEPVLIALNTDYYLTFSAGLLTTEGRFFLGMLTSEFNQLHFCDNRTTSKREFHLCHIKKVSSTKSGNDQF